MAKFRYLSTWPNLPTGVTTRPHLRVLSVFGVIELQIRRGWSLWKDHTPGYNFYEGTLPIFYIFQVQIPPRNRETNLPCFEKMEEVSPIHLQSLLPHQSQPCLPFIHENPTHLCIFLTFCFKNPNSQFKKNHELLIKFKLIS